MEILIDYFQHQLQEEAAITRKMLERVPAEKFGWQPHSKSMSLVRLATHVAEIPGWIRMTTEMNELDFAKGDYKPPVINNSRDLMDYFEKNVKDGRAALENVSDDILDLPWSMRNGEEIFFTYPKSEVLRMTLSQIIHHRAQLGVYLRMLDVPLPGSYGPSADEV